MDKIIERVRRKIDKHSNKESGRVGLTATMLKSLQVENGDEVQITLYGDNKIVIERIPK